MKQFAIFVITFLVARGTEALSLRGGRQHSDDKEKQEENFVILLQSEEYEEYTFDLLYKIETLQSFAEDIVIDFVCSDFEKTLRKVNVEYEKSKDDGSTKGDAAFGDLFLQEQMKLVNAVGTEESCRKVLSTEFETIQESLFVQYEEGTYRPTFAQNAALALISWQVRQGSLKE